MKKGIIITLPSYDELTEYLTQFSKEIINEAGNFGIEINMIKKENVNKKMVENMIKTLDYKMVIFNGHGTDENILGHKEEIIISLKNNHLLNNRIIYARSCSSAAVLGKSCSLGNTNGCFIGYDRPFQFYINIQWAGNTLKDEIAKLFLEPSNLIPISIIKGNSVIDANSNSKKRILKNINKVLQNRNEDSFLITEALWNNYEGQVICGNKNAVLE